MFSHLLAFALSIALASAADICPYTSRNCVGTYGCCTNVPSYTCCYWPSGYGWSTKFQNMPWDPTRPSLSLWYGQTYGTPTCSTTSTGGIGSSSTSGCISVWNAPNYAAAVAAAWNPVAAAASAREEVAKGQGCRTPDLLGFKTPDGKEHEVKIPEGRFDDAFALLQDEDFEALLNL